MPETGSQGNDDAAASPGPAPPRGIITCAAQLTAAEKLQFHDLLHAMLSAIGADSQPITDELMDKFFKAVFRDWDTSYGASLLPHAPDARTAQKMMLELGKFARDLPAQLTLHKILSRFDVRGLK
jgi:hypothetical protein